MNTQQFEVNRKLFHTLGLLCPIIYFFIPKLHAIVISFIVAAFVVYVDVYRHEKPYIQGWVEYFLKNIIRKTERTKGKLASCSWMFIGVFVTCLLYQKDVAIFSWIVLFICDSVAAVVGVKYGNNEIIDGKTFEGSLAFFLVAVILGIFYHIALLPSFGFISLVVACFFGTIAELYSKSFGVDDNISIPVSVGLILSIF
jgi:dolichol kinase